MLMAFSMRVTPCRWGSLYRHRARPRFSKTARSCPGQHEAGRHRRHPSLLPKTARRLADDFVEGAAERAQAAKADVEADVGDAAIRRPQQEHRAFDPPALQVAMRRLAEGVAKGANEMRLGYLRDPREALDAERLPERDRKS